MIRIGLCGFGGLGHSHANTISGFTDARIVAVCDILPERLEAKDVATNLPGQDSGFDVRTAATYTDFRTMLRREKPDVVVSALPTDIHAEYAILAMKAGCHVFSEKPMALTVAQCDAMIRARDRHKRQLMIGQCLRFWPAYEALVEAIRSGVNGRLVSLSMERIGGYGKWGAGNWFNDHRRSGAAILDLHMHDADFALYALGKPASIFAAGWVGQTGGIDDVSTVWTYGDGGPAVTMRGSWMHAQFTMNFRAIFERAVLEFGIPPEPALRKLIPSTRQTEIVPVDPGSAYVREMRYFLDCVTGKETNTRCPAESTRESVAMVYAEHRSIRSGRAVRP